jgi:hypothetical protein
MQHVEANKLVMIRMYKIIYSLETIEFSTSLRLLNMCYLFINIYIYAHTYMIIILIIIIYNMCVCARAHVCVMYNIFCNYI